MSIKRTNLSRRVIRACARPLGIATSLGLLVVAALLVVAGQQSASGGQSASGSHSASGSTGGAASAVRVINFTNALDTLSPIDVAPTGPSAGDAFYIYSHTVSGDVSGRTAASCVVASVLAPGVKQCEVDFLLTQGTITTRGLTDSAGRVVALVVTGGTGRYVGAAGDGTLTPTPTGSTVTLRLVGIPRLVSTVACPRAVRTGAAVPAC